MNVVFLDGASLPSPMPRPADAAVWAVREKTAPEQVAWASQSSLARLKAVLAANIRAFNVGQPINVVS